MKAKPARRRIAVMQPYFYPYAGYFRLFDEADEFVILDCVQFPRTGRVHRSEIARIGNRAAWLTLPLARQPRDVLIRDLRFALEARAEVHRRIAALPWLVGASGPAADRVRCQLQAPLGSVIDFLETGLRLVCDLFGLHTPIVRSSTLGLSPSLRGQNRILAICQARGADAYLNSPGGRELYSPVAFQQAGVALEFLPHYGGRYQHLLPALVRDDPQEIADELRRLRAGATE